MNLSIFNLPDPSGKLSKESYLIKNNNEGALEAEMVDKMAPLVMSGDSDSTSNYSPILDDQHSAAPLS